MICGLTETRVKMRPDMMNITAAHLVASVMSTENRTSDFDIIDVLMLKREWETSDAPTKLKSADARDD
jgi:hypothetical protein